MRSKLATRRPISIVPPCARILRAALSHIMPAPLGGYRNESIRVKIASCPFARLPKSAFFSARPSVSCLMRWAAQSAEISEHFIPHTFSVYVSKNIENNLRPKLLHTHCSKLSGFLIGKARALR